MSDRRGSGGGGGGGSSSNGAGATGGKKANEKSYILQNQRAGRADQQVSYENINLLLVFNRNGNCNKH